jgi:succinate dehydrogenase / fumarate reductase, cytochrome b subunit
MAQNSNRPISPHLQVYRWGPHMTVSIFHRATGFVLATAGMLTLLWWLYAIASGPAAYATFQTYMISAGDQPTTLQLVSNWLLRLMALGVVWSFFQHMFSGLRHLFMDIGAGYALDSSRNSSLLVFIASLCATAAAAILIAWRFLGV